MHLKGYFKDLRQFNGVRTFRAIVELIKRKIELVQKYWNITFIQLYFLPQATLVLAAT